MPFSRRWPSKRFVATRRNLSVYCDFACIILLSSIWHTHASVVASGFVLFWDDAFEWRAVYSGTLRIVRAHALISAWNCERIGIGTCLLWWR